MKRYYFKTESCFLVPWQLALFAFPTSGICKRNGKLTVILYQPYTDSTR